MQKRYLGILVFMLFGSLAGMESKCVGNLSTQEARKVCVFLAFQEALFDELNTLVIHLQSAIKKQAIFSKLDQDGFETRLLRLASGAYGFQFYIHDEDNELLERCCEKLTAEKAKALKVLFDDEVLCKKGGVSVDGFSKL